MYPHTPYLSPYLAPLHHHCTTSHHPYLQPLSPSQENLILAELGLPDSRSKTKDAEQVQEQEENPPQKQTSSSEEVSELLKEAQHVTEAGMDSFKEQLDLKRVLSWGDCLTNYDEVQKLSLIHI